MYIHKCVLIVNDLDTFRYFAAKPHNVLIVAKKMKTNVLKMKHIVQIVKVFIPLTSCHAPNGKLRINTTNKVRK